MSVNQVDKRAWADLPDRAECGRSRQTTTHVKRRMPANERTEALLVISIAHAIGVEAKTRATEVHAE